MGARLINTPPSKSLGTVAQYPPLTIAKLKERGTFKNDLPARWGSIWSSGEQVILQRECRVDADAFGGRTLELRDASQPSLDQLIRLISKPMRYGGHRWWFLCPVTGKPVETLYCVGGKFASARAYDLRYASQSEGRLDRVLRKRDKLEQRLSGGRRRGPSRGGKRRDAEEALFCVDQELSARMRHVALASSRRTAAADARRTALAARLQAYKAALRATPTDATPTNTVKAFADALEPNRINRRLSATSLTRAARVPAGALVDRGYLDTLILGKLGYLKDGQINGDHLSWPRNWIPEPDRIISLLVDLRDAERPSALVIFEDPLELLFQPLQLVRLKGDFGREELMFVCPKAKLATPVLVYAHGEFVLPGAAGEPASS